MVLNIVMSGLTGFFLTVNRFSECWDLLLNELRRRLLICLRKINADRGAEPRFTPSSSGRIRKRRHNFTQLFLVGQYDFSKSQ
jgi:hypothetical protein